jgi:hypothetical protein
MRQLLLRLAGVFSPRRIWGPALTILGLIVQAAHWAGRSLEILGRLDVVWRIVETMGGNRAIVARIISSWQFGLGLIVAGVGYTVFLGEPEKGHNGTHGGPMWLLACFLFA